MKKVLLLLFLLSINAESAFAKCSGSLMNPITDIAWNCIFPITIGGVTMFSGGEENPSTTSSPACICSNSVIPKIGIKVSFWEPTRVIETVSDSYCLNMLGTDLKSSSDGKLDGGLVNDSRGSGKAFQQMHYYIFPAWAILNMFMDLPCIESSSFDVAMMTEVVPTWNNEMLSLIVNPEAILFANPVASLACTADAIAATAGLPLNALFWCMGAWGNAYPLAGSITSTDYVEANAGIAARGIYFMGRIGLLRESSEDGCSQIYAPIWSKDRYRLQLMRPTKSNTCLPIGREGMLWTGGKHSGQTDNFSWMMYKKNDCCVSFY